MRGRMSQRLIKTSPQNGLAREIVAMKLRAASRKVSPIMRVVHSFVSALQRYEKRAQKAVPFIYSIIKLSTIVADVFTPSNLARLAAQYILLCLREGGVLWVVPSSLPFLRSSPLLPPIAFILAHVRTICTYSLANASKRTLKQTASLHTI